MFSYHNFRLDQNAHRPEEIVERGAETEVGIDKLEFRGSEFGARGDENDGEIRHQVFDFAGQARAVYGGHFVVKKSEIETSASAESEGFDGIVFGDDAKIAFFENAGEQAAGSGIVIYVEDSGSGIHTASDRFWRRAW